MIFKRLKTLFRLNHSTESPQIRTGIVRFFDPKMGSGYIYTDELLKDVRVSQTDAHETIKAGDKVQFELKPKGKKYFAKKVRFTKTIT